jgi:type II secretory pathway component HofQ
MDVLAGRLEPHSTDPVSEPDVTVGVEKAAVRETPSMSASVKFELEMGRQASLLDIAGEWYLVRRQDGESGWAHQSLFLEPPEVYDAEQAEIESTPLPDPTEIFDEKMVSLDEDATPHEMLIEWIDEDLLSLNFIDVDIKAALSAIAMEREISITTAQDVSGPVTVHLYNVSLEKALDAITLAGGFRYHRYRDLYHVYKPKQAIDPQAKSLQMRILKLKYAEVDKVREVLEGIQGLRTFKTHEPSKTIILEDTPENIRKVETVVDVLDRMPKQVLIEAKILEVSLTDEMTLGVDWEQLLGDVSLGTGGFSRAVRPTEEPVSAVPDEGSGLFGNVIAFAGTRHQFTAAIDALQSKTKVNTLSTPKILAIHGKPAKVQVGGQQGYRVTTTNVGVATETIEFIDTGTVLEITPYIDDDGNVLLNVTPSISAATLQVGGIPVVRTTFVSTWLLARNGETVFIGGLIQDAKSKSREAVPCLGGVPALGAIFGRTSQGINKSELIVLITPSLFGPQAIGIDRGAVEKTREAEDMLKKEPLPTKEQFFDFIAPVD